MYRWREEEAADNQLYYCWFKDRHYADIIERTAWALDDLATGITKSYRLMTADGREIAATRNIPPDDPAVSSGVTPDRCRALVWNPSRSVLVCCVGHLIYDYSPTTNVYTLRNTLTAGRDVQRAFYTTEADSGSHASRIVLVQCDMTAYAALPDGGRTATAWCTVLDATGTGAYTVLLNEASLGADVFPGTHNCREGNFTNYSTTGTFTGAAAAQFGENPFMPFPGHVGQVAPGTGDRYYFASGDVNIFSFLDDFPSTQNVSRGYMASQRLGQTAPSLPFGFMWPTGGMFSCSLNIYTAGGRLYYIIWDATNRYRLKYFDLYAYATSPSYVLALAGSAMHVPYLLHSLDNVNETRYMFCCQMEWWDETLGAEYSTAHTYYCDLSSSAWTEVAFHYGALSWGKAWMITEIVYRPTGGRGLSGLLHHHHL
jgi:hypothetical protein